MQVQRGVDGTDHKGHLHISVTFHVGALQVEPALRETDKRVMQECWYYIEVSFSSLGEVGEIKKPNI